MYSMMICLYIQNWRKTNVNLMLKMFSIQKISSFLNINSYPWHFTNPEYLKGYCYSYGQQQNPIGVAFHSPIEIILLILLGLIYSVFTSAQKFRSTLLASVRLAFCIRISVIICTSCQLRKIAPERSSLMFLVLQEHKLWKILFACCRSSLWDAQH